jgi:hypothetical protein
MDGAGPLSDGRPRRMNRRGHDQELFREPDMAHVIEHLKPKPAKYPWWQWADGRAWRVRAGIDFTCTVAGFRSAIYQYAARADRKVTVCIKGKVIEFQFVGSVKAKKSKTEIPKRGSIQDRKANGEIGKSETVTPGMTMPRTGKSGIEKAEAGKAGAAITRAAKSGTAKTVTAKTETAKTETAKTETAQLRRLDSVEPS